MNENRFEEDYGARQYIGHAFSSSKIVLLNLHVQSRDFSGTWRQMGPGLLMIY